MFKIFSLFLGSYLSATECIVHNVHSGIGQQIINDGEVHQHFSQQQQKVQIVSVLPHLECFVNSSSGREDEQEKRSYLDELNDFFMKDETGKRCVITCSSRFTISGMGGIGKTTLALKYAHDAVDKDYEVIWWIFSETKESFLQGYRDLLNELVIKKLLDIQVEILTNDEVIYRVKKELQTRKTLLVLDNVPPSYEEGMREHAEVYLYQKLPTGNKAHVLMTSRESNWSATKLTLQTFSIDEATEFLFKRTGLNDYFNARLLAEKLGCLPLALSYAAAYMKRKHISIDEYLLIFEKSVGTILSYRPITDYPHTLKTVFFITYQYLSEEAKLILQNIFYLDPDKIHIGFFLFLAEENKTISEDSLNDAFDELDSLSLVTVMWDKKKVSTHRLLQLSGRENFIDKRDLILKNIFCLFNGYFDFLIRNNEEYIMQNIDKLYDLSSNIRCLKEYSSDFEDLKQKVDEKKMSVLLKFLSEASQEDRHDSVIQSHFDLSMLEYTTIIDQIKFASFYPKSALIKYKLIDIIIYYRNKCQTMNIFDIFQSINSGKQLSDSEIETIIIAIKRIRNDCIIENAKQNYQLVEKQEGVFLPFYFYVSGFLDDIEMIQFAAKLLTISKVNMEKENHLDFVSTIKKIPMTEQKYYLEIIGILQKIVGPIKNLYVLLENIRKASDMFKNNIKAYIDMCAVFLPTYLDSFIKIVKSMTDFTPDAFENIKLRMMEIDYKLLDVNQFIYLLKLFSKINTENWLKLEKIVDKHFDFLKLNVYQKAQILDEIHDKNIEKFDIIMSSYKKAKCCELFTNPSMFLKELYSLDECYMEDVIYIYNELINRFFPKEEIHYSRLIKEIALIVEKYKSLSVKFFPFDRIKNDLISFLSNLVTDTMTVYSVVLIVSKIFSFLIMNDRHELFKIIKNLFIKDSNNAAEISQFIYEFSFLEQSHITFLLNQSAKLVHDKMELGEKLEIIKKLRGIETDNLTTIVNEVAVIIKPSVNFKSVLIGIEYCQAKIK